MTTNNDEIETIRKQTRLALPDDNTYLYRIGVALYGFASINSFMVEIICHIDKSQDQTGLLSDATSGKVLHIFRTILEGIRANKIYREIHDVMEQTAILFEKLNSQRTDFVHSYPITNSSRQQILHRRKDDQNKYFEVDNQFLDQFISELHTVSSNLYAIRKYVKPNLEVGGVKTLNEAS